MPDEMVVFGGVQTGLSVIPQHFRLHTEPQRSGSTQ